MRNFKKGFVEGSSRVSAGRTFKSMVEMKNQSLNNKIAKVLLIIC